LTRRYRAGASTPGDPARILTIVDNREELEAEFIAEILRIVGPGADADDYVVAPNTSDELLEIRVQRLRELPSGIGHDELMRRVGPRKPQ
jgi:hypothetical protein